MSSGRNNGEVDTDSFAVNFTIKDGTAGQYELTANDKEKTTFHLVDDPNQSGTGLKYDVFEADPDNPDSGHYRDLSVRLNMTDPGVIFMTVSNIVYDSQTRDWIRDSTIDAGLATRVGQPSVPVTKVDWAGENYPVHSYTVDAKNSASDINAFESSDTQISIAAGASKGTYTIVAPGEPSSKTFTLSGGRLKYASARIGTLPLDATYNAQVVFQGPYGRLYNIGVQASFDGSIIHDGSLRASWTDPIVNIAPTLNRAAVASLSAINEDDSQNSGTSVHDLLASAGSGYIYDANTTNSSGIALIGTDNRCGAWEYSIDGGQSWTPIVKASPAHALLLADDALLRFEPKLNYNGTRPVAIAFKAWDGSIGTNSSYATTVPSGGTTAFSSVSDTASIVVTPVDDAPVISAVGRTPDVAPALAYAHGRRAVSVFSGLTLTDIDTKTLNSATIIFSDGYTPGTDVITYKGPSIIHFVPSDNGTFTLSSTSPLSLRTYLAALKGIYFNTSTQHAAVKIEFTISSGTPGLTSQPFDRVLQIA